MGFRLRRGEHVARYFLYLRDGTDEVLDPEGIEYGTVQALRNGVLTSARDLICGDIAREGIVDLRYRIDAGDSGGNVVWSLPFGDAIDIVPGEG